MITGILNAGFGHAVRFIATAENIRKYGHVPVACLVKGSMRQFMQANISQYNGSVYNLHDCKTYINRKTGKIKKNLKIKDQKIVKKLGTTSVLLNDFITNINKMKKLFPGSLITCCLYHGDINITGHDSARIAAFKNLVRKTASHHDIFFHINLKQPQYSPRIPCTYIPIPIVARQVRKDKAAVNRLLGLKPDDPFILIHAGAAVSENIYAQLNAFYQAVNELQTPYPIVISSGLENNPFPFRPGIIKAPLFYNGIDLVNASELVVSKPGMGILQDCIVTKKPLLFLPGDFAERDLKIRLLDDLLSGRLPVVEKINAHHLKGCIESCISMGSLYREGYSQVPVNGADVLARAVHLLTGASKNTFQDLIPAIKEMNPFC